MLYSMTNLAIAPILYRFYRCSSSDVTELQHWLMQQAQITPKQPSTESAADENSLVLFWNIALSELWSLPNTSAPSSEWLAQVVNSTLFNINIPFLFQNASQIWPTYPLDEYNLRGWAFNFSQPLLLLNGNLDPATPLPMAFDSALHYNPYNSVCI